MRFGAHYLLTYIPTLNGPPPLHQDTQSSIREHDMGAPTGAHQRMYQSAHYVVCSDRIHAHVVHRTRKENHDELGI